MSRFARNQLEKFGWKEGMGLGKKGEGLSTYVRAKHRSADDCTGIGHTASIGTSNTDMGYDQVLQSMNRKIGKDKSGKMNNNKRSASNHSSTDEGEEKEEKDLPQQNKKRKRLEKKERLLDHHRTSDSESTGGKEPLQHQKGKKKKKEEKGKESENEEEKTTKIVKAVVPNESSSSSSSSDSEPSRGGGVNYNSSLLINDKELFQRCGNVRLGRGGRHRLFDGKLARVEKAEKVHHHHHHEK